MVDTPTGGSLSRPVLVAIIARHVGELERLGALEALPNGGVVRVADVASIIRSEPRLEGAEVDGGVLRERGERSSGRARDWVRCKYV